MLQTTKLYANVSLDILEIRKYFAVSIFFIQNSSLELQTLIKILAPPTTSHYKTDFPRPDLTVSCLSDGVQVVITLSEIGFNGILYVKGHSKDEKCRRVISIDQGERIEYFKVSFGTCGLIHVNVSFL